MRNTLSFTSVRPLVRYVDEQQAVIETWFTAQPAATTQAGTADYSVNVLVDILGSDGFHDENRLPLQLSSGTGRVRFEVVHPQRWWPAGMGAQPLYQLTVSLLWDDRMIQERTLTLGLTSVRAARQASEDRPMLLVNGRECSIQSVLMMDRGDEQQFLPAAGDSLVLVRDHYGSEVLYEAADRAGILLIQCVPPHPPATPEADVAGQVDRLSAHPSLAGYFVEHLGRLSDLVAARLRRLDPTRPVFRRFPHEPSAA